MDTRFHRNPRYQNDVVVIAIDANPPDQSNPAGVQTFCEHIGATFTIGTEDLSTTTYASFVANYKGLNPFPVDIVVGKDGMITYISREYDGDGMQRAVDAALAAP